MRNVSKLAENIICSEILKIAAEVNQKIKRGEKVYNLTVGDFDPKIFPIPYKFALGMVSCSIGFMILYMTRYFADEQVMVSSGWLVASYFFQALGELFVSALGVAMVAELVSPKIMGFVMGMWFLTSSVAGFTGAAVASLTALPKGMPPGVESLTVYTHVFLEIGVITLLVACVMGLLAPSLTRWMEA